MDRAGAQEMLLPVGPSRRSCGRRRGRWENYGDRAAALQGPQGRRLRHRPDARGGDRRPGARARCAATAQLPLNLYQIQTKFRDELRPRAGLMRGREFIMKDAYSFDVDERGRAARVPERCTRPTRASSRRCGLAFRAVEADTGAIGGSLSHEFQVLAESGEDAIVACDNCDYAANVEQAELRARRRRRPSRRRRSALERSRTPGKHSIEDVSAFLKVAPRAAASRRSIYLADGKPVAALVRGDRDVNEIKLKKRARRRRAGPGHRRGGPGGHRRAGRLRRPGRPDGVRSTRDLEVLAIADVVAGANEADTHLTGVNLGRDFTPTRLRSTCASPRPATPARAATRATYKAYRGIEVGHVFFLGTKYSEPMKCDVPRRGRARSRPMVMGCYGIGVTRIVAGRDRAEPRRRRHHLADADRAVQVALARRCSRTTRASSRRPTRIYDELDDGRHRGALRRPRRARRA